MKFLILPIIFILNINCYSQNNEFEFDFNFGTALNNLKNPKSLNYPNYDYRGMSNVSNKGVSFLFKYKILKKYKFYISTGLSFSNSKYFIKITDGTPSHISNVYINKNYFTLKMLGIYKEFDLYSGKLKIEFGINAIKRLFFKTEDIYSTGFLSSSELNFRYKYNLKTYYYNNAKKLNLTIQDRLFRTFEYSFQMKYGIFENTFLNFGLKFSKKHFFYYDFKYDVEYRTGSNPTIITYYSYFGSFPKKRGVLDDFLSLDIGLSYKF